MIAAKLEGVDFVVANTDAQALAQSKAERRIQLGAHITEGLGAGAQPDIGRAGAEESLDEIMEQLAGAHMVFITAGMGGGTGTGAAPVIARAVREHGILTVGVVTKPFAFEGDKRMRIAEKRHRRASAIRPYADRHSRTRICSASPTTAPPSPRPSPWPTKCCMPACAASPT